MIYTSEAEAGFLGICHSNLGFIEDEKKNHKQCQAFDIFYMIPHMYKNHSKKSLASSLLISITLLSLHILSCTLPPWMDP